MRLYFLEPLICRSRMELTICIFNKLLDGADAASQWTTLWEMEQLLSGMRETKRIRGKKGHHRENRKPLKREGTFQRQNSHVPQELPWLRICHQTTLIPAPDCLLPFGLLLGRPLLPIPADSIPLRLQGLVPGCFSSNPLPSDLSPFAGFIFHMLTIPISSSDLPRLQDTQIQLPTWCFTLMNNRHLRLNMSTFNPWLLPFPTSLFLPITHSGYWGCHSWLLFFFTTHIQSICKPHQSTLKTSWTWPCTTTSFFQAIIFLPLGDYNHSLPGLPASSHHPPRSLLSSSARWPFPSFYHFMPCLWLKTLHRLPNMIWLCLF